MQKIKSIKLGGIVSILKCCLIGIVASLIGTVIFAIVLKFANFPSKFVSYINDIIKVFSIFIMIACLKKKDGKKLFIKSVFAGVIYAVLSFFIYSILNGTFAFGLGFAYDLLFAVIVSMIVSVIINVIIRKNQ